jgi:uncharacterized protein YukE
MMACARGVLMMADGKFAVDLEALAGSASHVTGQAEDLAIAHLASDNRIEAAQSGWVGSSAAALSIKAAAWRETSRTLLTRVGGHAMALHSDGIAFAAMEREGADALRAVGQARDGIAGSAGA